MEKLWDATKWLTCLVTGHKWRRFGYTSKDDDLEKDDTQLFWCPRCHAMPMVKHNGTLPRWVLPIHWTKIKNECDIYGAEAPEP